MKVTILFTAIFDSYDKLNEVTLPVGWRAICFSNIPIESKTWEIVIVEKHDKIYRDIKIRPHVWLPEHDKSVWIDGNLEIAIPLDKFVEEKDGFWLMDHPDRNCVYEEAKRCIELNKDNPEVINAQMERYRLMGLKEESGLCATGCIIRDNNWTNKEFNEDWWKEVKNGSVRDQLSWPYVSQQRCFLTITQSFPFLENIEYHYHVERQSRIDASARRKKRFKRARTTEAYRKLYGK